jgi:peptidoglycan/LPS O-acetylase OafA/YrhL
VAAAGGPSFGLLGPFGEIGYFGVDIFFVISGYIMWHSTRALHGPLHGFDFAYRRASRIYSGYWPYFLIALVISASLMPQNLDQKDLLGSFFLTRTPIPELLIPVAWTLSFELYFYLLFTLLILLPERLHRSALFGGAAMVVLIQIHGLYHFGGYSRENFAEVTLLYRFFGSSFLLEFIAGALLAAGRRRLNLNPLVPFGLFLLFLAAAIWYQNQLPEGNLSRGYYQPERVALLGSAALFCVWSLVALEDRRIAPFPRQALYLGAISYSLYLSHTIILGLIQVTGVQAWIARMEMAQAGYLAIILLIVLYSALHYHWIESPLRHLFRRFRQFYLKRLDIAPARG